MQTTHITCLYCTVQIGTRARARIEKWLKSKEWVTRARDACALAVFWACEPFFRSQAANRHSCKINAKAFLIIDYTIIEKLNLWHTHVDALTNAAGAGDGEEWSCLLLTHCFFPPLFFFFCGGAQSELSVVQVLHSDDYNATRVQYITLISHTGAQWYHN